MTERLALAAGLTPNQADLVRHASAMHDVGKIGIPDSVLHKAGPLTDSEWKIMRTHPLLGARILSNSSAELSSSPRRSRAPTTSAGTGPATPPGSKASRSPGRAHLRGLRRLRRAHQPAADKHAWSPRRRDRRDPPRGRPSLRPAARGAVRRARRARRDRNTQEAGTASSGALMRWRLHDAPPPARTGRRTAARSPAPAATHSLTATRSADRDCTTPAKASRSVVRTPFTAPHEGTVTAHLTAARARVTGISPPSTARAR